MKPPKAMVLAFGLLILAWPALETQAQLPDRAALSEVEADRLRDAQDPGERIKVYLDLEQARLTLFDDFRKRAPDPEYDVGGYLSKVLEQYVKLDDEMKDWIDLQFRHDGDMRKGLKVLVEEAPKQLEVLQHAQEDRDPYSAQYLSSLQDAIADMQDTIEGGSKALSLQNKKFGQLKRVEKQTVQDSKQMVKEEKKRMKEEKKLRKKEQKKAPPEDDND
ncbi:MAG TPA: hypothetical protein VMX16_11835 [Terriglobia bacterium]|nr:hypothetical protein [Terriglobia bacterium]